MQAREEETKYEEIEEVVLEFLGLAHGQAEMVTGPKKLFRKWCRKKQDWKLINQIPVVEQPQLEMLREGHFWINAIS